MTPPSKARIEGTVAQLLNERELIISAGKDKGVKVGMRFAVMSSHDPIIITDPDTGERLGEEHKEKVRVIVTRVEERYSVCQAGSFKTPGGSIYRMMGNSIFDAMLDGPRTIHTTFNARKEDFPAPLDPDESYVQRGDKVIQVLEAHSEEEFAV